MKSVRILGILALLVGAYAIAGFYVAPKLIRNAILEDLPKKIDAVPAVGEVRVNPFLFQVTVDKFSLSGRGGEKLLSFERLFIDFELSSLWRRAFSFANIDVRRPQINISVASDGALNLARLVPKSTVSAHAAQDSGSLPALHIGSLKVSSGLMNYEDHSRPDEFTAHWEPIDFELREFSTGTAGGKFTFTGASKLGERIEWHGHLAVQPFQSDGEFRIDGLLAHTLWEYFEDKLNFSVNSGTVQLAATYNFSATRGAADAGRPVDLQVDLAKLAVHDLTVRAKTADTDWIVLPSLTVTGTHVDLGRRAANVESVALRGLKVLTWLESDGSVNLLQLATPAAAPPAAQGAVAAPRSGASPQGGPAWQFGVREVEVREAEILAEDRSLHPAAKLLLAPFNVQIRGVSQDLAKPVGVTLDARINEKGTLALSGAVTPQPLAADLNMKLGSLDLPALQPYIAQRGSMTLVAGRLGGEAKLHYGATKTLPAMQVAGNFSVEKLHTVDNALQDDFINWDRLDIVGLDYSHGPDRLGVEQITARKPYARVIIESDGSWNVKRVLALPGAAPTVAAAPPDVPGSPTSKLPARIASTALRVSSARTAAAIPAAPPSLPMLIKKVSIDAGQVNFTDLSVKPNFSTGIQALAGTVVGISSKPASRARIDLRGGVGAYSPVTINGELNVATPLHADIAMAFRNIELTVFNPYSDKFAGYNITKGKLTTELHYKVDGRLLDAQHHVVIDQLEFGDKTPSKDAVSLPVKLAVALLKDRNGVIDLDLPVSGSLDDPQFRLAPLIWKVVVQLIEKAVTAPFALLGSLFGGGPEIQFIDFEPGIGTLDAAATEKIKAVAKALIERPQLKIEVPLGVLAAVDGRALIDARFNADVNALPAGKGGSSKAPPAAAALPYDQLDPVAQLDRLTRLYEKYFGAEPKFPEALTSAKAKPDGTAAKIAFLSDAVRRYIVVGDGDLQALGQQRAGNVQQALLADAQVGADRVFLVSNDKVVSQGNAVRLELSLR